MSSSFVQLSLVIAWLTLDAMSIDLYFLSFVLAKIVLVVGVAFYLKATFINPKVILLKKQIVRSYFSGSKLYFGSLGQMLISQIGVLYLGGGVGDLSATGNLSVANSMIAMFIVFSQSVGFVFLSNAKSQNSWFQQRKFILLSLPFLIVCVIISYIFSPAIFRIFGDGYENAALLFRIIVITSPIIMVKYMLESQMLSNGLFYQLSTSTIFVTIGALFFNLYFIPIYSDIGAAIAISLTQLLYVPLIIYAFIKLK
ncbi:hypothetical protein [Vibrio cionasavignyae]|uniref:hypothetical protein n=1 Tax=Vibrio cionasavignyae TaxID=2910252 RepID=UPI003D0A0628